MARLRIAEAVVEDEAETEHIEPLPSVDQTVYEQLEEHCFDACGAEQDHRPWYEDQHDEDAVDDSDAELFWKDLDPNAALEDSVSHRVAEHTDAGRMFHLFQHDASEEGVCDAVIDILDLTADGSIRDVDHALEVVENLLNGHSAPREETKEEAQEVDLPNEPDGLPSEDTIAFLFDHTSQERLAKKAEQEPAFKRLVALRERLLARLNRFI